MPRRRVRVPEESLREAVGQSTSPLHGRPKQLEMSVPQDDYQGQQQP